MDTLASYVSTIISSINYYTSSDHVSASDKTADKIYGFVALMEFGLHPMRTKNTKYIKEYFPENKNIFKFSPMVPDTLLKSTTQGIMRYCLGATQKDLFIMDEELITVIRRYVWDPEYKHDIFVFLHDIVKPGLVALRKTYDKKETLSTKNSNSDEKKESKTLDIINHIDNWIVIIDCALPPTCREETTSLQESCSQENPSPQNIPTNVESFCTQIAKLIVPVAKSTSEQESNTFFELCLLLMKVNDTDFGKQIKKLVTPERLQRINKIYAQSVISRENASLDEIKQANETFNQFIIAPAEEQMELLHKEFLYLYAQATSPYPLPQPENKPQHPQTFPIEIKRPGGVRRPPTTPKTTPTHSISISPLKEKLLTHSDNTSLSNENPETDNKNLLYKTDSPSQSLLNKSDSNPKEILKKDT